MKKFAIWANVENSQLLVLVEFPHLTYNQSEHEAYTVTERLNFLMLKCAKYTKTFPHLSITEQFGNLNLHLYDLVLMRPSVTITITQIKVKCLKSCLIVSSKYRIPLTHGLTLVPSWFRPAAGRLLDAHSLTVSAHSAALPPAVPHPKQTAFIPFIHWHSPRSLHTHLPPLESAHCSTEPVKGITCCKIKLLSYFT